MILKRQIINPIIIFPNKGLIISDKDLCMRLAYAFGSNILFSLLVFDQLLSCKTYNMVLS